MQLLTVSLTIDDMPATLQLVLQSLYELILLMILLMKALACRRRALRIGVIPRTRTVQLNILA